MPRATGLLSAGKVAAASSSSAAERAAETMAMRLVEMVDVGLPQTDSKEGLLDAAAPEGGEAKAMV